MTGPWLHSPPWSCGWRRWRGGCRRQNREPALYMSKQQSRQDSRLRIKFNIAKHYSIQELDNKLAKKRWMMNLKRVLKINKTLGPNRMEKREWKRDEVQMCPENKAGALATFNRTFLQTLPGFWTQLNTYTCSIQGKTDSSCLVFCDSPCEFKGIVSPV